MKDDLYGVYLRLHPLRERLVSLQELASNYEEKGRIASASGSLLSAIEELDIIIRKLEFKLTTSSKENQNE